MEEKMKELAAKLQLEFDNIKLLQEAMTHRSYLNEHRDYKLDHNERLEFLGDAVLELVVTEHLFQNYNSPEGDMTSWRAALVCGDMLASISKELGVEEYMLMSRGESKDTGRARQYLLANVFESIVGAIYLDKGYESAKQFILRNVIVHIDEILEKKLYLDPKSYFQEKAQEKTGLTPGYREHSEEGPDHEKRFVIGVYLGSELVAEGEGNSKQEAQREAARKALEVKEWV